MKKLYEADQNVLFKNLKKLVIDARKKKRPRGTSGKLNKIEITTDNRFFAYKKKSGKTVEFAFKKLWAWKLSGNKINIKKFMEINYE